MPVVIDPAALSVLIALIYDCAIDPAAWPIAMEAMRTELGLFNCSLDLVALPSGRNLLNHMTNVPEPYMRSFADYAAEIIPVWGGAETLARLPFDEPAVLSKVVGPSAVGWSNRLFTEWAAPQGICDLMGIYIARDARSFGSVGMARHRDGPPIDDRLMAKTRLFVPHLQRAAAINRLLDLAALREATFDALFDTLSAPVLLVDEGLHVVHANRAGRTLLGQDRALQSRGGQLVATDRAVHHALAAAIRDATGDYAAIGRKGMGIPIVLAESATGALHVLPLRPDHPGGRRLAAIFVAGSGVMPVASSSMVGALFGLTPTERAVFEQVAGGRDVPRAARELGVAQSTVRTHLLRIYDKTGVRRQAELVRLSASLGAPAVQA